MIILLGNHTSTYQEDIRPKDKRTTARMEHVERVVMAALLTMSSPQVAQTTVILVPSPLCHNLIPRASHQNTLGTRL